MTHKIIAILILAAASSMVEFTYAQEKINSDQPPFRSRIELLSPWTRFIIKQTSFTKNCSVNLDELRLLKVSYWGFDDQPHLGTIIINKNLAKELENIFHEIYQQQFPIRRIATKFTLYGFIIGWLESDNTQAFTGCRLQVGSTKKISWHSYGMAIDINPVENPYVKGRFIIPSSGYYYLNRNRKAKGMIKKEGAVYKIFTRYGWSWGGNWKTRKDYMHFQKVAGDNGL